jgi:hypothetical protein
MPEPQNTNTAGAIGAAIGEQFGERTVSEESAIVGEHRCARNIRGAGDVTANWIDRLR